VTPEFSQINILQYFPGFSKFFVSRLTKLIICEVSPDYFLNEQWSSNYHTNSYLKQNLITCPVYILNHMKTITYETNKQFFDDFC